MTQLLSLNLLKGYMAHQQQVLVSVVTLCLLLVVGAVIRRIFIHPLSSYSGPWLGKFTDLEVLRSVLRQERTFRQHELLQKYGSPVRMATNHLVYADEESFTQIYGQSSNPCLKDNAVYGGLSATGAINILNVIDRDHHARLRRLVSHSFSLKSLLESEAFIQGKVDEYLSIFQGKHGQRLDILERTYQLVLDIVSQLSFGESFHCLRGMNSTAHDDVKAFFTVVPAMAFAPVLRYLPIKSLHEGLKGLSRLQEFSRAHVAAYVSRSADKNNHGAEGVFLQNLATAVDAETGTKLTQEELVENTIIFLTAGSGTTAATLIYLMWECGRQPKIKQKLIEEIRAAFPDPSVRPSYREASQLKYLNCVIGEVLRLRGPLNVSNTRVSPGKVIGSQWVPKGVTVETCTYSTVRNPDIFPDPTKFDPSRWEHATNDMRHMSRPFSYGPRNCVGRHLAEMSLIMTVARLYQLYDIVPDPSLTEASMMQVDQGVLEPGCHDFYVTPVGLGNDIRRRVMSM